MVNESIPATRKFLTRKELDIFVTGALAPVVVALLPEGEQGRFWEAYLELANLARGTYLHFWYSDEVSLAKGLGLPAEGGVLIARPPRSEKNSLSRRDLSI